MLTGRRAAIGENGDRGTHHALGVYIRHDPCAAATPEAAPAVEAVRAWARRIRGFRDVVIVERVRNLGLAGSIVDGVTQLCAAEDD